MAQAVRQSQQNVSLSEQVNVPPNSVEAEQALLGGLMLDNRAWDKVAGKVSEADFYRPDHRLIFVAIQELADRNERNMDPCLVRLIRCVGLPCISRCFLGRQ